MSIMNTEARRIIPIGENGEEARMPVPSVPVQKVQTKYTTAMAVQNPRELAAIEGKALSEASLLGADAFYAWGEGKNHIEGPSKELAMALVRCYGNCAVDMGEVQETRDAWIFTATFVDFETGFNLSRQFRQAKDWQVFGRHDDARKDDIRFQIGQSKATRNVILNALPGWLVARAMDKAKGGVRDKIEKAIAKNGLEAIQGAALKILAGFGADESRVLEAMGRKTIAALTLEDLVLLEGNIAALKSKADTVESMFPIKADKPIPPAGNATDLKAQLAPAATGIEAGLTAPAPESKPAAGPILQDRERWPDRKSPASPGYWRLQLLAKARSFVEAFPTDACDNSPEEIVARIEDGHAEPVKRIAGPTDKADEKAVVQQYKDALAFLEQSPDHWSAYIVPL